MGKKYFMTGCQNNCGGSCLLKVELENGKITGISSEGKLRPCVRGRAYRKTLSGERLKYPLKRVGARGEGKFVRITWQEAIDIIAGENSRIKKKYGAASRYVGYAWGYSGTLQPMLLAKRLLALDGGYLDFYNSYSTAATKCATPYTFGTAETGSSSDTLLDSKLIILWGHNPVETIFGADFRLNLLRAKKRGCRIIAVDPRYSDSAAALADEWIALRPTSDAALMDAMAYVMVTENLYDKKFLDKFCLGHDSAHMPTGYEKEESYFSYLCGERDNVLKTPEWAEKICGVAAEKIRVLAREYASIKPAALIQGFGPQRHAYGEQAARGATVLAAMTGNVGIRGGFASGCGYVRTPIFLHVPEGENPFKGRIPVFLWTKAVENAAEITPSAGLRGADRLESNIKMIWNLSGECLLNQHGDINYTAKLLSDESKVEFILGSNIFMTPSSKFADVLLPGTTMFEEDNLKGAWHEGNYLCSIQKIVEPPYECRFEYYWLKELAARLGVYEEFTAGNETMFDWCRTMYDAIQRENGVSGAMDFAAFREKGVFYYPAKPFIAFSEQIEDFSKNKFPTPSGKIEIFSPRLFKMGKRQEIPPIPKYIAAWEGAADDAQYPLQLIGWHWGRRCHTVHDNNAWLEEMDEPRLWLNPVDAKVRRIADGDMVEVFNRRGKMKIKARVTVRIMIGVAAVPQGGWHTAKKDGEDVRGSINVLTSLRPTPLAKGNAQHTMRVEVKKI